MEMTISSLLKSQSSKLVSPLGMLNTYARCMALITVMSICACATPNSIKTTVPVSNTGDDTQAETKNADFSNYLTRAPEDDVIYFMLPDRFENGDKSNDTGGFGGDRLQHGYDPEHRGFYHGGDLRDLPQNWIIFRALEPVPFG